MRVIRQEKETRCSLWEIKLFLLTDAKVIYLRDPKDSTRKILKWINPFQQSNNRQNWTHENQTFSYNNSKAARKKLEKILTQ